jgi:SPP1 gp7 family putative phage head morphogenesis protein
MRKLIRLKEPFIYKYKVILNAEIRKVLTSKKKLNKLIIKDSSSFSDLLEEIENSDIDKIDLRLLLDKIVTLIIDDIHNTLDIDRGADYSDIIESFYVAQNTLARSLLSDMSKNIALIIKDGVTKGSTLKEVSTLIQNKINATKFRAETIAITELSRLHSDIFLANAKKFNIKKGSWSSAGDSRVRKCHLARHGKEYDLARGCYSSCDNKYLQAGEEIRCRCGVWINL